MDVASLFIPGTIWCVGLYFFPLKSKANKLKVLQQKAFRSFYTDVIIKATGIDNQNRSIEMSPR